MSTAPLIVDEPTAMLLWSRDRRATGVTIGLVPTMGALHEGHHRLIEHCRRSCGVVVVSIFVNPLQFDEPDDLAEYPRPLDTDVEVCGHLGVDVVYAPTAHTMYSPRFDTRVVPGLLATAMEGARRPGHFEGVATVVAKLFNAVQPDIAVFGEKDFQQLSIIKRMVVDLDMAIDIVAHPTVRESDGLAMSSRNRRLSTDERRAARCVPDALRAAANAAVGPHTSAAGIVHEVERVIESEPLAVLEYVQLFDDDTLGAVDDIVGRALSELRVAVAVRIGDVRLIDNTALTGLVL